MKGKKESNSILLKINIFIWASVFLILILYLPLADIQKSFSLFPDKVDIALNNLESTHENEINDIAILSTCIVVIDKNKNDLDAYCLDAKNESKLKPIILNKKPSHNDRVISKGKPKSDYSIDVINDKDSSYLGDKGEDYFRGRIDSLEYASGDKVVITLHEVMESYNDLNNKKDSELTKEETMLKKAYWLLFKKAFSEQAKLVTAEFNTDILASH